MYGLYIVLSHCENVGAFTSPSGSMVRVMVQLPESTTNRNTSIIRKNDSEMSLGLIRSESFHRAFTSPSSSSTSMVRVMVPSLCTAII